MTWTRGSSPPAEGCSALHAVPLRKIGLKYLILRRFWTGNSADNSALTAAEQRDNSGDISDKKVTNSNLAGCPTRGLGRPETRDMVRVMFLSRAALTAI